MTTEISLRNTPVVVGFGIGRLQPECPIVGVYRCFKGAFFVFLAKITDRKPSLSRKFLVGHFRDNGDRAPLFYGFFDVSFPLKQDGGGNRLVYRGCRWITLYALRGSSCLGRIVMDSLSRQPLQKRRSFVASGLDLVDEVLRFFSVFSGRLHIPTCFGYDLPESPEAEIPGNEGDDTEQGQEDGRCGEPPIDDFRSTVQQFTSEIVEAARDFSVGGDIRIGRFRRGGWLPLRRRIAGRTGAGVGGRGGFGRLGRLRSEGDRFRSRDRRHEGQDESSYLSRHRVLRSLGARAGHATHSTCLAASRMRIWPQMNLGSNASRRATKVCDS